MKAIVINTLLFLIVFSVMLVFFTWLAAEVTVESTAPGTSIFPLLPGFASLVMPGCLILSLYAIFLRMNRAGIRSFWAHLPLLILVFGGFFGMSEILPDANPAPPGAYPAPVDTLYPAGDVFQYHSSAPFFGATVDLEGTENGTVISQDTSAEPSVLQRFPWYDTFFALPPEFAVAVRAVSRVGAVLGALRSQDLMLYIVTASVFWLMVYMGVGFFEVTRWPLLNLMIGFGVMQAFPVLLVFLYGHNAQELGGAIFRAPFTAYWPAAAMGIAILALSILALGISRRGRG